MRRLCCRAGLCTPCDVHRSHQETTSALWAAVAGFSLNQSELNWNVPCADSPALQRQAVHVESEEEAKDSSTQSRGWVKKAGAADVRTSAADFAQTLRPEKP